MKAYLELLEHVLEHGTEKSDRTGTGTRSVFGWQMRFNLNDGFPLVTTKKLHLRSIIHELLWFLKGDTNIGYLKDNQVRIWDEWADANGDLGPIYGKQWRSWATADGGAIDQMQWLVDEIKRNPDSRRLVVTTCSSSMWWTAGSAASCTSAAATSSWACPSTSPATRCSPTWWRRRPGWASAISCTRWAMRTCIPTTTNRPASSWRANRARCPRCG
jgi:hypothetical protein